MVSGNTNEQDVGDSDTVEAVQDAANNVKFWSITRFLSRPTWSTLSREQGQSLRYFYPERRDCGGLQASVG